MAESDLAEPTAKQKKSPPAQRPKEAQKNGAAIVPSETAAVAETPNDEVTLWVSLKRYFEFGDPSDDGKIRIPRPDAQAKARLLYNYCISSNKNVPETVHSLFILGEHYATSDPEDIDSPELINGIPTFFKALSNKEKSVFCYNQVTEALSSVAMPVTVNSLLATRRIDPQDASSSFAGRFVQRVTRYVTFTLAVIAGLYLLFLTWNGFAADTWRIQQGHQALEYALWIAFGCVGALVHLLNHALTTTRLQTFEISEERKVWPRLLLGGMFGFVLPWLLSTPGGLIGAENVALGTVAAFFGGYSVRFAIGLLERVLSAFLPETDSKK